MPVLVVSVLAVLAAVVVLLLAAATPERERVDESPWRAFRRGLQHDLRAPVEPGEPQDVSLADVLATADVGAGYVTADELHETVERARSVAAGSTARATDLAGQVWPARTAQRRHEARRV